MPPKPLAEQIRDLGCKIDDEVDGKVLVKDVAGRSLVVSKIIDGYLIHVRTVSLPWRGAGKLRGQIHVSAMIRELWQGLHTKPIVGRIAPDEFIRQQLDFYLEVMRDDGRIQEGDRYGRSLQQRPNQVASGDGWRQTTDDLPEEGP